MLEKRHCLKLGVDINATRFGEISPLWRVFSYLWQFFECFFHICQNFEPTLATFYRIGQMFIVVNGQILNKLSNHLVTLVDI